MADAAAAPRRALPDQAHLAQRDGVVDAIEDLRRRAHAGARPAPPRELELNDIGRVRLRTSAPLVFDPYSSNRRTGSFILIDEATQPDRRRRDDRRRRLACAAPGRAAV